MGSLSKIDDHVKTECAKHSNTLSDWGNLFRLAEMSDSSCTSVDEIRELNDFTIKAAVYKTPKKLIKFLIKIEKYNTIVAGKSSPDLGVTSGNIKFARSVYLNFEKVDD